MPTPAHNSLSGVALGAPRPVPSAEFIVLGSGCFSPGPIGRQSAPAWLRNPAGYALHYRKEILLFDLGFGNFRQMVRLGLDPNRVSHVFVTHRHLDHLGDLPALLFYYYYGGFPLGRRLSLYGPRGFKGFMDRLIKAHHPWLKSRRFRMSVRELDNARAVKGKGWRILARKVPHSTEALAYRFESPEGSFCYSGDTGFDEALARFASRVDLLALECTLADKERSPGHLRVSEALALGRLAKPRTLLLTHLSAASARDLGRRVPAKGVRVARDGMRLPLSG